ncbi:hypothetical protein SLEP1_g52265 [Rubroshorea leprosula]|uniref:Glycoside hydrolase family 19 catalytic domain-containing protein n=1 Tax=Rubroshorea leprosula TaxID=152421 RepID=A0AAV5M5V1_9ROSI|nr:hypothetical protein SLEP1_g52265 [Rubroshorea leprosula]
MKREISKSLRTLTRLESNITVSLPIMDAGYDLLMLVKSLRESSAITISSFRSLLLFFSMPVMKTKAGVLFSKLIPVAAEKGQKFFSEVRMTDVAVCNLCRKVRKGDAKIDVQMELSRLETIYDKMRGFESGLDCLFRSLIRIGCLPLTFLHHDVHSIALGSARNPDRVPHKEPSSGFGKEPRLGSSQGTQLGSSGGTRSRFLGSMRNPTLGSLRRGTQIGFLPLGGALRPNGLCCSQYGWCGYCTNCQSQCGGSDGSTSTLTPTPAAAVINGFYMDDAFIAAAQSFNGFGTTGDINTRKRELAAFLAQTSHETSGKGTILLPIAHPVNGHVLLANNTVAEDPSNSHATTTMVNPSSHNLIIGQWTPSDADISAGRIPAYGVFTNIINGGVECGHGQDYEVDNRIGY